MQITNVCSITQIQARHIDKFIDVYQDIDGIWRCVLLLTNGIRVPASRGMTLNEIQLSNEARIKLYAHISSNKKVAPEEPKMAPAIAQEAIQSLPATSADNIIETINPKMESISSNFKAQSNFKTRKL